MRRMAPLLRQVSETNRDKQRGPTKSPYFQMRIALASTSRAAPRTLLGPLSQCLHGVRLANGNKPGCGVKGAQGGLFSPLTPCVSWELCTQSSRISAFPTWGPLLPRRVFLRRKSMCERYLEYPLA